MLGVESAGAPVSSEEAQLTIDLAVEAARSAARRDGLDEEAAAKSAILKAKAERRDRATQQAMHEFNVKLRKDRRVDQLVLPLRDGITIARVR